MHFSHGLSTFQKHVYKFKRVKNYKILLEVLDHMLLINAFDAVTI